MTDRDEQLIRAALDAAAETIDCGCENGICCFLVNCPQSDVEAIRAINVAEVLAKVGEAQQVSDAAKEDGTCTCGAGHGSMEGHTDWCDWTETTPPQEAPNDRD